MAPKRAEGLYNGKSFASHNCAHNINISISIYIFKHTIQLACPSCLLYHVKTGRITWYTKLNCYNRYRPLKNWYKSLEKLDYCWNSSNFAADCSLDMFSFGRIAFFVSAKKLPLPKLSIEQLRLGRWHPSNLLFIFYGSIWEHNGTTFWWNYNYNNKLMEL